MLDPGNATATDGLKRVGMDPSQIAGAATTSKTSRREMPPTSAAQDPSKLTGPERRRRIVLLDRSAPDARAAGVRRLLLRAEPATSAPGHRAPNANVVDPAAVPLRLLGRRGQQAQAPRGRGGGSGSPCLCRRLRQQARERVHQRGTLPVLVQHGRRWRQAGNPVHLAIKGNEVWVTDRRLRSISVFDLEGKFLRTFEPKNEKLNWTPLALGFDKDGALRVTDVGNTKKHRVIYFSAGRVAYGDVRQDRAGQRSSTKRRATSCSPTVWRSTSKGNVYISDGDNRRVQVFSPDGDVPALHRHERRAARHRNRCEAATVRGRRAGKRRRDLRLEGKSITQFGSRGFGPGQFNYPNDVTLDKRGRIYVTDRENNQVQVWGWPVGGTARHPDAESAVVLACVPACRSSCCRCSCCRRKIRIVVTPDFVDGLAEARRSRPSPRSRACAWLRPIEDEPTLRGPRDRRRDLTELITFEEHSESDVRSLIEKLQVDERQAMLLAMTWRAKALGTQDRELRWLAVLAEVRAVNVDEFQDRCS